MQIGICINNSQFAVSFTLMHLSSLVKYFLQNSLTAKITNSLQNLLLNAILISKCSKFCTRFSQTFQCIHGIQFAVSLTLFVQDVPNHPITYLIISPKQKIVLAPWTLIWRKVVYPPNFIEF